MDESKTMGKKVAIKLAFVLSIFVGSNSMAHSLNSCPNTPNCVSSLATGKDQHVAPLKYTGNLDVAKTKLLNIIKGMPRTKIITLDESYVHTTFTSLIFRFTDDVEFLFDDESKLVQLRSASRVGRSDLGVNRKRVEEIRLRFEQSN